MRRRALGCCLTVLFSTALSAAEPRVDPSEGVIDGKVAVSFWPGNASETSGCTAHLVPDGNHDEEIVYPCGQWLRPQPGKYKYWLEAVDKISPSSSVFTYAGGVFQGRGMVVRKSVEAGGRVALAPENDPPPSAVLRLLHLDSHHRDLAVGRELSRRVASDNAHAGVLMPEGEIVAALYDNASREYLGVTRPVTVNGREVTLVDPRLPSGGTDLIVKLERPAFVENPRHDDVELRVEGVEGGPRAPQVVIPTPDRIYALWYGLRGNYARLTVSSPTVFMEPEDVPLRPGRVESHAGVLRLLPGLDVTLDFPEELEPEKLTLTVVTDDGYENTLRQIELPPDARSYRIDALRPERLRVTLDALPWEFEEAVDLSDGLDKKLTFRPQPIRVQGTVYRGDEEHPAVLIFRTTSVRENPGLLTVTTDDEGSYSTIFFRPWRYHVDVRVDGPERAGFNDVCVILADMTLDFHLPANRYEVRVVDELTGAGVSEATLSYSSRWGESNISGGHSAITDENGLAKLPPLRPGRLDVRVLAEDYFRSDQEWPIDEAGDQVFTVALKPVGETDELRVLLPNGLPARDALVGLLPGADVRPTGPPWSDRADAEGKVRVPETLVGRSVVALHPQAAFLIRRWQPSAFSETVWTLPQPAPPLVVHTVRPSGGPTRAVIGLVVDGHRLTGSLLTQLTRSRSNGTNREGVWTASHLPPVPVTVCAWSDVHSELAFRDGLLDSLAVTVPYPWPQAVEVPVAD